MDREKILASADVDARSHAMRCAFEQAGYRVVGLQDAGSARIAVLPMPYTEDGEHVKGSDIGIDELFSSLGPKYPILGGRFDWNAYNTAMHCGIRLFDYYENESAKIENAHLTSQAAIALACEQGISLLGERVLVCGYGRIGKILCRLLASSGAYVYAAARKDEDLAMIKVNGYEGVRYSELSVKCPGIRLVYNTVPHKILDSDTLAAFGEDTVIIELASEPCADESEAVSAGVKYVRAPGLPGKYYPSEAGKILARSAIEIIKREGLLT